MDFQQLGKLGWKSCYSGQLPEKEESNASPVRVGAHFGSQILCLHWDHFVLKRTFRNWTPEFPHE